MPVFPSAGLEWLVIVPFSRIRAGHTLIRIKSCETFKGVVSLFDICGRERQESVAKRGTYLFTRFADIFMSR
jgi:hypothetical protein